MRFALVFVLCLFMAAPAQADPTIVAVGDLACPPLRTETATRCHHHEVSDLILRRAPVRTLLAGDLQYDTGRLADYRASFAPTYGRIPGLCPVPGNHEYGTAGASGFYSYFGANAFRGGRTCPVPGAPNWSVIGLDSGPALGCSADAWQSGGATLSCLSQTTYLRQRMAEAPTCELVYFHHPRFSAEADDSPRVQPFLDAFYAGHGDLVVNGHSHTYERFGVTNPYGVGDPAHGFRTIIAGTGGIDLRPFDRAPRPASQVRDATHFGALFITLHPAGFDVRFISPDGVVRDQILNQPCRA